MGTLFSAFVLGSSFTVILVMALFFWYNNKNMRIRKILSSVLFCNALLLLKDVVFMGNVTDCHDWYVSMLILNNIIIGIDFLYVYELLKTGVVSKRTVFLSTFMFVLLALLYFIFRDVRIFEFSHIFSVIFIVVAISNIIYFGRRYKVLVKKNYSDPSRMDVAWLWSSVVFFILIFFLWRLVYYHDTHGIIKSVYYFVTAVIWSFIAYRTWYHIPLLKEDIEAGDSLYDGGDAGLDVVSDLPEGEANAIGDEVVVGTDMAQIKDLRVSYHFEKTLEEMRNSEFFCENPKISLVELSEMLGTNRTTLSYYINSVLKLTFYDLTNDARIRHAEALMSDPDYDMTQEELAAKCGFNSLSTFRRVFIDKKGCTPKKYYHSLRNPSIVASADESADGSSPEKRGNDSHE